MSKRGGMFGFKTGDATAEQFNDVRETRGADPDYLYYNAMIINNSTETTSGGPDPPITFQDTRSTPILNDKSTYAVSVENFTINGAGKNLPLFIPQIRQFNSDGSSNQNPNNTIYDLTFTWQTSPNTVFQSTRSVQWVTENKASWVKKPVSFEENIISNTFAYPQPEIDYYYCTTYSHWLECVNTALSCAWGDVKLAATTGGVSSLTIIMNGTAGVFTPGNQIITNTGAIGTVYSFLTDTLVLVSSVGTFNYDDLVIESIGNGTVDSIISYDDETGIQSLLLTDVTGTFNPGDDLTTFSNVTCTVLTWNSVTSILVVNSTVDAFQIGSIIYNPVGIGKISSASIPGIVESPLTFGTKCPFFTYDKQTNLFSLWQDANTSIVPYGQSIGSSLSSANPSNPPNPLNVYGSAIDSTYSTNEYSFIGYNTNFEALFTNFNTTYYSDQIAYPSLGVAGVVINSPLGTETCHDAITVMIDTAHVESFNGNEMSIAWNPPGSVEGTNWTFGGITVVSNNVLPIVGTPVTFPVNTVPAYVTNGISLTGNSSIGTFIGIVTEYTYESITIVVTSFTGSLTDIVWTLKLTPLTSKTSATPVVGTPLVLSVNLPSEQSPFQTGKSVSSNGMIGNVISFTGVDPSDPDYLGYTSALPGGFNPTIFYTSQYGSFKDGDVIKGTASNAQAQIVKVIGPNTATGNIINCTSSDGLFNYGDLIIGSTKSDSATIVSATGGSVGSESYTLKVTNQNGAFGLGSIIQSSSSGTATVTAISSDNTGYATVVYAGQKNAFSIGDTVYSGSGVGTIENIIGENTGYMTVGYSNAEGQFGNNEFVLDISNVSGGTIVSISGDNTGYSTLSYINAADPATGAPSKFVTGEFLTYGTTTFAKVIIDTPQVQDINNGNQGEITVLLLPLDGPPPYSGTTIVGTVSGTQADFGALSGVGIGSMTLQNINGRQFMVGDNIIDITPSPPATAIVTNSNYNNGGTLLIKVTAGYFLVNDVIYITNSVVPSLFSILNATGVFSPGDQITWDDGGVGNIVDNYGIYDGATTIISVNVTSGVNPDPSVLITNISAIASIILTTTAFSFGSFTVGNTITGGTSHATGVIEIITYSGGGFPQLTMSNIVGTFQDGELLNEGIPYLKVGITSPYVPCTFISLLTPKSLGNLLVPADTISLLNLSVTFNSTPTVSSTVNTIVGSDMYLLPFVGFPNTVTSLTTTNPYDGLVQLTYLGNIVNEPPVGTLVTQDNSNATGYWMGHIEAVVDGVPSGGLVLYNVVGVFTGDVIRWSGGAITLSYLSYGGSQTSINVSAPVTSSSQAFVNTTLTSRETSNPTATIISTTTSNSNAIIQTFGFLENNTLTLSNAIGTFETGDAVQDATTLAVANINTFGINTTAGGSPLVLTVKDVFGSFGSGDVISDGTTSAVATIGTFISNEGGLIVKPLIGTFDTGELILDLTSNATATTGEQTLQTITSTTGSATVLSDNGSLLHLSNVTGAFAVSSTFIGSSGEVGTVVVIPAPVITIMPTVVGSASSSWVLTATPLTSISSVIPDTTDTFLTNLSSSQSLIQNGDTIEVQEVTSILTVQQLYYPENVVQVKVPYCKFNALEVGSAFLSNTPTSLPYYVVVEQDYESTSSIWSPIASLVIGTLFIPVRLEYTGTPIPIGTGNLGGNFSTNSFQQVLLETPLEVLPQSSWRGLLSYSPKVETLTSLEVSKSSLKELDFKLYWRNRLTNTLTPLTLYNGGSANIRLMFKKVRG